MRQLLLTNGGVKVARMPAPAVDAGSVLIHVNYSMVSVGTEIATLRPAPREAQGGALDRAIAATSLAQRYLGAAVANPRLAVRRAREIMRDQLVRLVPRRPIPPQPDRALDGVSWSKDNATQFNASGSALSLQTDASDWHYQARSSLLRVPAGYVIAVDFRGTLDPGQLSIGLLDEAGTRWLGTSVLSAGPLEDRLVFDPQGEPAVRLVVANAQGGVTRLDLTELSVALVAPDPNGVSQNEMDASGWNLGYSAAGVVVAVGEGVNDLVPGDRVACGGAGRANHADFVTVPRNLVCRVPEGCAMQVAATTTIGTIALQGVRRSSATLGETICVVGLGLLGQITAQLLRASGCTVIGMDLDPRRVERAKQGGMAHGATSPEALAQLVRDLTRGRGVDRTLMVAATKSDAVINMAMEITRRRGTVVIVGDVGLNVQRPQFYRKEIDLLMSTSYGPGRYDADYEEKGVDYPFAYVRWTLNRNMQSYLELAALGRLDIASLIDEVAPIEQAPGLYRRLATASDAPLGVLLAYPDPVLAPPQPLDATRVSLRGHRKTQDGPMNAVLVGAGAFGQAMLVPMMERRRDRFFLRGVVSRDTIRGGNFARERRLDILATELPPVLDDDSVQLLVIATRHNEHARQVAAGLKAGKNVFVEKPLAVSWDQLDEVVQAHESLTEKPQLMVGFNRRFSPAMQALEKVLRGRRSPLIVNYRLNGGFIAPDHWIQTADGAGRNIGEACHMYDVFRFLAGQPVSRIGAQSIDPHDLPYLRNDNFCATLGYADGSVCNLVYTALGPKKGLAKEHVEVFCDGEAYVVDDYKSLVRASDGEVLWKADAANKGHAEEISRWGDVLAGQGAALIPFEEIVETTAVALHVEDLLFGRVEPS